MFKPRDFCIINKATGCTAKVEDVAKGVLRD